MALSPDESRSNKFMSIKHIYENHQTRIRYCQTKLQKIVLSYLSWGRLFFFGSSLYFNCKHWWLVLALALFSTFLYFLLFIDALIMFSRTQAQLDSICDQLTQILVPHQNQQNLAHLSLEAEAGASFSDGNEFDQFRIYEKMLVLDHSRMVWTKRKVYIFFTVSALLAFIATELYAANCLLCNN